MNNNNNRNRFPKSFVEKCCETRTIAILHSPSWGVGLTSFSQRFFFQFVLAANPRRPSDLTNHELRTPNKVFFQQQTNCFGRSSEFLFVIFVVVPKYSRLRCLLRVKGLLICFYLGWSGSILQVGSKSWLLTCRSNITLSLPSYTGSALKRELNLCNGYLSLLYFCQYLAVSK